VSLDWPTKDSIFRNFKKKKASGPRSVSLGPGSMLSLSSEGGGRWPVAATTHSQVVATYSRRSSLICRRHCSLSMVEGGDPRTATATAVVVGGEGEEACRCCSRLRRCRSGSTRSRRRSGSRRRRRSGSRHRQSGSIHRRTTSICTAWGRSVAAAAARG
jgi:hypothetical protein